LLFCGDLTILLLGLAFHCFVIENRKSLCHSLGRPSRSDFVQFQFVELRKSEFVERFPELSLFFKAYSLLDSEMICIFPYFCPYAESAREIREIFS